MLGSWYPNNPSHDGLHFIRGGIIADETEPAAAARLLEEYVGINLPPVSFRRVLSVPSSNDAPTPVQVYGITTPPELLVAQMRSCQAAEQIVFHSVAIQNLGDNPICPTSITPLRHQRAVIVPHSVPPRYAIPFGALIPWPILNKHLDAPGVLAVREIFVSWRYVLHGLRLSRHISCEPLLLLVLHHMSV